MTKKISRKKKLKKDKKKRPTLPASYPAFFLLIHFTHPHFPREDICLHVCFQFFHKIFNYVLAFFFSLCLSFAVNFLQCSFFQWPHLKSLLNDKICLFQVGLSNVYQLHVGTFFKFIDARHCLTSERKILDFKHQK